MTFEHLGDEQNRPAKGQLRPAELSLILTGCERLEPKDFGNEVRAQLDVELFVSQAELMLEVDYNITIRQLIEAMLSKVRAPVVEVRR